MPVFEPMLPHTFCWEADGIDERGAHTVNVWCNECDEKHGGMDASEATEWGREHTHYECPWCGRLFGGVGADGDPFEASDPAAIDAHMRAHVGASSGMAPEDAAAYIDSMRDAGRGGLLR